MKRRFEDYVFIAVATLGELYYMAWQAKEKVVAKLVQIRYNRRMKQYTKAAK